MAVRYFGGEHKVFLGDRVRTRILFRSRIGRVVYVPGLSAPNPEFEKDGMRWVGIRLDDGSLVATVVSQHTHSLKKKVVFLGRDASPCKLVSPEDREFEKDGEG